MLLESSVFRHFAGWPRNLLKFCGVLFAPSMPLLQKRLHIEKLLLGNCSLQSGIDTLSITALWTSAAIAFISQSMPVRTRHYLKKHKYNGSERDAGYRTGESFTSSP